MHELKGAVSNSHSPLLRKEVAGEKDSIKTLKLAVDMFLMISFAKPNLGDWVLHIVTR